MVEARVLVLRMGQLSTAIVEHLGMGSPGFGPGSALIARGHMHSIYTHIDRLLFQENRDKAPYPLELTVAILSDD